MKDLANNPLEKLKVSPLNMKASRKKPKFDDTSPSIRERGILVPLLVRRNGNNDQFEIVAGRRRFFTSTAIEKETGEARALPYAALLRRPLPLEVSRCPGIHRHNRTRRPQESPLPEER